MKTQHARSTHPSGIRAPGRRALLLGAAAAFALSLAIAGPAAAQAVNHDAKVRIQNQYDSRIIVTAEQDGRTVRIGVVPAGATLELELPGNLISSVRQVRFSARAVGAEERHISSSILVHRGAELLWSVAPESRRSQAEPR